MYACICTDISTHHSKLCRKFSKPFCVEFIAKNRMAIIMNMSKQYLLLFTNRNR